MKLLVTVVFPLAPFVFTLTVFVTIVALGVVDSVYVAGLKSEISPSFVLTGGVDGESLKSVLRTNLSTGDDLVVLIVE